MSKVLLIITFLFSYKVSCQNFDDNNEAMIEKKLVIIRKKLETVKKNLNDAYGKEKVFIDQLQNQDLLINKFSNDIKDKKIHIRSIKQELEKLKQTISVNQNKIDLQKAQILDLLKLHVYLNHDKTLKMLLINPKNQQNNVLKHQVKYLQNKLYKLIKNILQQQVTLEKQQARNTQLTKQEQLKLNELNKQQNQLSEQRKKRLITLNLLKKEINLKEKESQYLNKDQKRLFVLLKEIKNLLSDLPSDLGSNKPFKLLKKKLKKPVKGQYIRSFKSRRSLNTKWQGVVIKANLSSDVKSVAYGRVAYADWLRGFGMLVIIDHHDGYMSLYGFNESINIEMGDWVNASQTIGTVGNSGTLSTPALYFEIRKDAVPLNPKLWLKK